MSKKVTCTFPQNASVTDKIDFSSAEVRGEFYLALHRGAGAWVAASVGIEASDDNVNWYKLKVNDTLVGVPGATLDVEWSAFVIPAFRYIRLLSHTAGTATNQTEVSGIPIEVKITRKS